MSIHDVSQYFNQTTGGVLKKIARVFQHKSDRSDASHAILDTESRKRKAKKIADILKEFDELADKKILDVGTGSGHIANHLGEYSKNVTSIDIHDERRIKDGYEFVKVKDENIPLSSSSYDVVVSNHVIEHTPDQAKHVENILNVLKKGGLIYLATPNKLWITDPHYKLPFISWLPRRLSEKYLETVQGKEWDIYPLSTFGIHKHFSEHNVSNALPILLKSNAVASLDTMNGITSVIKYLPPWFLQLTGLLSPTLIYVIRKK